MTNHQEQKPKTSSDSAKFRDSSSLSEIEKELSMQYQSSSSERKLFHKASTADQSGSFDIENNALDERDKSGDVQRTI